MGLIIHIATVNWVNIRSGLLPGGSNAITWTNVDHVSIYASADAAEPDETQIRDMYEFNRKMEFK